MSDEITVQYFEPFTLSKLGDTYIFAGSHKTTKIPIVIKIDNETNDINFFNFKEIKGDVLSLSEYEVGEMYKEIISDKLAIYKKTK